MTRSLVVAAFVTAWLLPVAMAQEKKEKKDQEAIQGSWKVVKLERHGKVNTGAFREDTWIFKDDELSMVGKDKTFAKAAFKLDPSKKPKSIEMPITDGASKGKTRLGIYRIDGDKLMICHGEERPKEFSGEGKAILLEFERVKEK